MNVKNVPMVLFYNLCVIVGEGFPQYHNIGVNLTNCELFANTLLANYFC